MRHAAGPPACAGFARRSKVPAHQAGNQEQWPVSRQSAPTSSAACCGRRACERQRISFDEGKIERRGDARASRTRRCAAAVRLQESVGLDVITDGEMRRLNFQDSFGAAVEGFDANRSTIKSNERRVEGAAPRPALGNHGDARHRHGGLASPAREGAAAGSRAMCRSRNTSSSPRSRRPRPRSR